MDLFGALVLKDGGSRGEPCCVDEDWCEFPLLPGVPSASLDDGPFSWLLVSSVTLSEAGRLGSVGEGNGDASLGLFGTDKGSGLLECSFSGLWSASPGRGAASVGSVMLLRRGDRQMKLVESDVRYQGGGMHTSGINRVPVMYD